MPGRLQVQTPPPQTLEHPPATLSPRVDLLQRQPKVLTTTIILTRRLQSSSLPLPEAQGLHLRRPRLARRPRRQQLRAQVPREARREGMVQVGQEDVEQQCLAVVTGGMYDIGCYI